MPGKVDWLARDLPSEGERAGDRRVGALARDDVITCGLEEPVEDVRPRIEASPYGFALVMAADGTILGRLRGSKLGNGASGNAEDVMDPGPSTVRPDLAIDELLERLTEKDLKTAIVSTPEGRLIGIVRRADLETEQG